MDKLVWWRISTALVICALIVAAWRWTPIATWDAHAISTWLAPHRQAWYAMPMVMAGFVVLGLVPVLLLIAATGIAFGPVLGPLYAMAGALASASTGFAIGRWMGRWRVERLGGERVRRIMRGLERNGTLAVFLVRKIPAPFMLVNIVIGASTVRYRDFLLGTLFGMLAIVIALAGFGYHLTKALARPTPATLVTAAVFISVPLTLAWVINRALRPVRPAE
jgi:uncharacterized membrane protein YdjX (TVP38/TMEM64 family)